MATTPVRAFILCAMLTVACARPWAATVRVPATGARDDFVAATLRAARGGVLRVVADADTRFGLLLEVLQVAVLPEHGVSRILVELPGAPPAPVELLPGHMEFAAYVRPPRVEPEESVAIGLGRGPEGIVVLWGGEHVGNDDEALRALGARVASLLPLFPADRGEPAFELWPDYDVPCAVIPGVFEALRAAGARRIAIGGVPPLSFEVFRLQRGLRGLTEDERIVPLADGLLHEEWRVRNSCLRLLLATGARAVSAVVAAYRARAAEAERRADACFSSDDVEGFHGLSEVLSWFGTPAVPYLATLLAEPDRLTRRNVAMALQRIAAKSPENLRAVLDTAEGAIENLTRDPDPWIRHTARQILRPAAGKR